MLSVAEAEKIILQNVFLPASEEVELTSSLGRVLAEDLVADRDFPPFDRVTMDGIAICHAEWDEGRRQFAIEGIQAAGAPRMTLEDLANCLEVMTGAMLPDGADTVVRYEDLRIENGIAAVLCETVFPRQNIHFQGIDRQAGALIVQKGQKIGPAEIAVAATVGKTKLRVARLPRTAIVSTGDELVDVGQIPLPHQIRSSNVFALRALLECEFKMESQIFHFPDDRGGIARGLEKILREFEIVVLSGAVSEGKFDFVPQVLNALGVEKCFHKVSQRPGKPFWFGRITGRAVIFALPGNPVSAFLCACRYLLPFLRKSMGESLRHPEMAALNEAVSFKPALTYFLPVRLTWSNDGLMRAQPSPGHGSGDLANLSDADGFLELPVERDVFRAGEAFPVHRYRF
ncbi:MAG: molybdopterin molybdotransferase MoeA [Saprospiraceae bacterium]|nr:molybdopterin molybdotransferase MoeA [Saprospiraceae bacterium]